MSTITADAATLVIQAGIENNMYPHGKTVPEDEKTRKAHADELLELTHQIAVLAAAVGKENAPNWPLVVPMIEAAGMDPDELIANAGAPKPAPEPEAAPPAPVQAAPEPSPAPEPAAAPAPTAPQPVQAVAPIPPGWEMAPSPEPERAQEPVPDPMAGLTQASEHTPPEPVVVPKPMEIWEGPDTQSPAMRVVEVRGEQVLVELKGVPGQHPVPRAFLVRRVAEAPSPGDGDYDGPAPAPPVGSGNPVEQQVSPQPAYSQIQQAAGVPVEAALTSDQALTAMEESLRQEEQAQVARLTEAAANGGFPVADPFTQAMEPAVEAVVPVAAPPAEVKPVIQPVQVPRPGPQNPPPADAPRSTGGFPVADELPSEHSAATQLVPHEAAVDGELVGDKPELPDFPLHNSDGDAQYKDLLEEVERRHMPAGMPIPRDLTTDLPIIPEDLTKVEDEDARAFYSLYNALAARARYLHDLEAGYARACGLLRDHHWRKAVKAARAELGKDATLEEVKIEAELDEDVTKWRERRDRHTAEAASFKTFFDINSDNVRVLSRDWTMRDKEQQGN